MRYLTKSRFRLALECITKLYYTKNKDYADESIDDPFLKALSEGGFQVGELAKYHFCDDPVEQKITIETLDYDKSLELTKEKLKNNSVVIAEAAFKYQSLFVRADIIVKEGNVVNIYEVKSKSSDGEDLNFFSKKGDLKISAEWIPYIYDIAFQKYVVKNTLAKENITVHANLILVDKSKIVTVDGLNQKFKILKVGNGSKIEVEKGLTKAELGESILKIQNIDEIVQIIWDEYPVPSDFKDNLKFDEFVKLCADIYTNDVLTYTPLGRKCKDCQFVNRSPQTDSRKSGYHECWKNKTHHSDALINNNSVLDLWGGLMGSRSIVQELINKGKYLLDQVTEQDIAPKNQTKVYIGLSPLQRRMEQIKRVKDNSKDSYFDKDGFLEEMSSWEYPLHMIDFETSMPAIPFHKGRHPYEGIAFQFSHHTIEKNGDVCHAGQYLSFEQGIYPNYEFIRALKSQLENDEGTIFRYHNHENTYLNFIYRQLYGDNNPPNDREELGRFIRNITTWKEDTSGKEESFTGNRCMVDLYKLVLSYYYSPYAKGSNSIKSILPALIHDSEYLKSKYSKPIYGRSKQVKSLNFGEHVWIDSNYGLDPYKTLPRIFQDYDSAQLDKFFGDFDELADGGAAMTAYNYLQFSHIPEGQREELKNGLLRYCELDTMAMVMILEGWINL